MPKVQAERLLDACDVARRDAGSFSVIRPVFHRVGNFSQKGCGLSSFHARITREGEQVFLLELVSLTVEAHLALAGPGATGVVRVGDIKRR